MNDEPKHISQVLAEMALEHAERGAYMFSPSSYTHAAMMALRGVVSGKPEVQENLVMKLKRK